MKKKWKFLCSQNGWEYAGLLIVTAEKVEYYYSKGNRDEEWDASYYKKSYPDSDGNTILADGVEIYIDEDFEFQGEFTTGSQPATKEKE